MILPISIENFIRYILNISKHLAGHFYIWKIFQNVLKVLFKDIYLLIEVHLYVFDIYAFFGLGSVHYLYPRLVPKRNGLGKPFFWGMKGWVNIF